MLKPSDMKISLDSIGSKLLLVEVKPKYEYAGAQRTDKIVGYGYTVVLPEKAFEKLTVRIDGKQLMDAPNGYTEVHFDGLELFIYWSQGQYNVGARATGIHAVTNKV